MQEKLIKRRPNGSFVINFMGNPFGLGVDGVTDYDAPHWLKKFLKPEGMPNSDGPSHAHNENCVKLTWENVKKYADAYPEDVEDFDDAPPPPKQSELIMVQIYEIENTEKTTRLISEAALGEAYAVNKLKEINARLAVLRTQLAEAKRQEDIDGSAS